MGISEMSMNPENALRNLIDVTNILSKHDVIHWIQNGTLLGLYREGTFIDYDTDIDFGLSAETFTVNCYKELLDYGFQLKFIFGRVEDSLEIALSRFNIGVDLFFHYITDDIQYHCIFDDWSPGEYRRYDYRYKQFNVKRKVYLDTELFVPEDELLHLKTNYGENWAKPTKSWNIATSPSNVHRTDIVLNARECTRMFDQYLKSCYYG